MDYRIELIDLLIQHIKEERAYTKWYNEEEEKLKKQGKSTYDFYCKHRAPNKSAIRDSLRMLGRLGFQLSNEV